MWFLRKRSAPGYTLIEVLITMAITGLIVGATVNSFITQRNAYTRQEQVTVMLQNARAAMDMMVREIRMAGYGVPPAMPMWIDWVGGGFTDNPQITPGSASSPDAITFAHSFDAATLVAAVSQGDTALTLSADKASVFNTTTKKVVFIGRNEYAVITNVSGGTLTVDTNPTTADLDGLKADYPVGTPVELLRVITYKVANQALRRDEHTGAGAQSLVDNIEDLQVNLSGHTIQLTLVSKTEIPDVSYTHPTVGDAYRRTTLTSWITLRNPGL